MLIFILPLLGAIKSKSYPKKLTLDEEKQLLDLYKNHNDTNARAKLIEHNLRLVAHIVKKYENTNEEKDDLLSIGIIGLIKAIDTYQIKAKSKLATYASRCIENEILMSLRQNKKNRNLVHLEKKVCTDKDGNEMMMLDFLEDKDCDVCKNVMDKFLFNALNDAISKLDSKEYDIIKKRYGINCKAMTQKQIAKSLNISRSYVSRIEKRALLKLYFMLKDHKL